MRLRDFSPDKVNKLTKVKRIDLKLLWQSEYWDGPLNGLLSYEGLKYWFQVFDEPNDYSPDVRKFLINELSSEQLREEEQWHELFRQKVGTHTEYDEDGKGQIGELRPEEEWHEFYDAYKNRLVRDFSNNQVISWFED